MHQTTRSPVMIGRAAERATVNGMVDAAAAGTGGALLVTGEAGIGKTRLLDEAARRAEAAGMVVLSGRAVQGGGTYRAVAEAVLGTLDRADLVAAPELRPYRAVLGRLMPGWAGADPGPSAVDPVVLLGEGLLRLLRTTGRGCLLRLEDLHWADDDTVALVEHLAGLVTRQPVLLAVSARVEGSKPVTTRLARVPSVTTVALTRLTEPDVVALAAACQGGRPVSVAAAARLMDRSEGLPFLVEELLDPVAEGVPSTLVGLVTARLATLTGNERDVLRAAAVLGGEVDWRLLGPTAGVKQGVVVSALRAAVGAALLTPKLAWPHALTREAVLATLLPPERAILARTGAAALAARACPDDLLRAAELYADAGDPDAATRLLLRLARTDAKRGALRSAERLLDRAAATGGAMTEEVALDRVAVLTLVGRIDEAITIGTAALGTIGTAALGTIGTAALGTLDGDRHAEMCLRLARAAVVAGRWRLVDTYVERAGRPEDPRSLVLRADAAFAAGHADEAAELAAAAIERAESTGAAAALCEALGVASRAGRDPERAICAMRRAAQVAAEHGLTPLRVEALTQLGIAESLAAAHPEALHTARQLALDAGMPAHLVTIDVVLTELAFLTDGPGAAEPYARRAVATVAPLGLPQVHGLTEVALACVLGAAGDAAGLQEHLEIARQRAGGDPEVAAWAAAARGIAALLEHDLASASTHLDTAMAFLLHHASAPPLHPFGLWALLHAAAGNEGPADRVSAHPASRRPFNRKALGYAYALLSGRSGRAAEAAARFAVAEQDADRFGWLHRMQRLVALEGAVVDGWGDPVPLLLADLELHERAGDAGLARTCRDLLRRAGRPVRRSRGGSLVPPSLRALGVTSREVDVLGLVATGMTNTQVAARLFLSGRTVDTHVANLLAKTGARDRRELARFRA